MKEEFLKRKGDLKTELKEGLIEWLKESVDHLSGRKKWKREKQVVEELLCSLCVKHGETELTEWSEPVDVAFRDARFQVKEMMQFPDEKDRRRQDEYKSQLQKVKAAEKWKELTPMTPYREVRWNQIVTESIHYTTEKIQKYADKERRKLDVVCYYNRHDRFEAHAATPEFERMDCRSFSIVSNSYVMVLFATSDAPTFLQTAAGTLYTKSIDH